jgi:hypothetical protein
VRRPSWRSALLGGVLCGLFGLVLVRIGVALLVGGVRVLAVLVLAVVVWAAANRLRQRG